MDTEHDSKGFATSSQVERVGHAAVYSQIQEELIEDSQISASLAHEKEEIPGGYFWSPAIIATIFASSISCMAAIWGFAATASIISFIAKDITASDNSSLFAIIWSLSSPVSTIAFGRLSDRLGRRWFVIGANFLGIIGAIVAGTAKSMNQLIGANVMLGLATGIQTSYPLIVGELVPHKYKFFVIIAAAFPILVPSGFGAYIGRRLFETATWRWVYWCYIIMLVPPTILQFFFYFPPNFRKLHGPHRTRTSEFKKIDFVGLILLTAGLFCFLLGIAWGGQPAPWSSGKILGLIIGGAVGLFAFVLWELYSGVPVPIIPMRLFRDVRGFDILCVLSAVGGIAYIGPSIIWPSQVNTIFATPTTTWETSAWRTTTVAFGSYGGTMMFIPLMTIIKHFKYQAIFACAVSVSFIAALSTVTKSKENAGLAFSFIAALPVGWFEVATGLLVQLIVDDMDLGIACAIISASRMAFGAIASAIFVTVLNGKLPTEIARHVLPAALGSGLPETSLPALFAAIAAGFTPASVASVKGLTPDILVVVSNALSAGYSAAYAYVYYTSIAFSGFALVVSFFIMDYDPLFTGHVSRQIYKHNGQGDMDDVRVATVETKERSTVV